MWTEQEPEEEPGGGTPVTPEPEIKREPGSIIPDGAKYTKADGTVLEGNGTNVIPSTPVKNDTYREGDYVYTYDKDMVEGLWYEYGDEWSVVVEDTAKTEYGAILSGIAGKPMNNMAGTFRNCASLVTAPVIPDGVINMYGAFESCPSLTTAPAISNSVTDMGLTFAGCTSLKTYVGNADSDGDFSNFKIPDNVTYMGSTFLDCKSLVAAPVIPDSVTNMSATFSGCTSLTTAPTIPSNVTNMGLTFSGCMVLKTYAGNIDGDGDFSNFKIPNNVTDMYGTFQTCQLLTAAPTIPSSVDTMNCMFCDCISLTGVIEINANSPGWVDTFFGTVKPITITGSCTNLTELAASANNGNVTVA